MKTETLYYNAFRAPPQPTQHPMRISSLALLSALVLFSTACWAAPGVVVSIKPIHGLTASIMEGVGMPRRLLPDWASPHAYALRPSDARALEGADLVIWIGPELENFLTGTLTAYKDPEAILTLIEVRGLTRLPIRRDATGAGDAHHEHAHEKGIDGHIWLDPHNAALMTRAIAATLAEIDPVNAATYQTNLAATLSRLDELDRELTATFAEVSQRPYVVLHDAFQYLERRYALNPKGSLTLSATIPPSARRLRELRERIRALSVACVFAEPQASDALLKTLVEGSSALAVRLDPLGFEVPEGPESYAETMRRLAGRMAGCLRGMALGER